MGDISRYKSLLSRQKQKLAHARKLAAKLEKSNTELGPNPSNGEVAEWLQKVRFKPGPKADSRAKWVAQTVADYLEMDGVPPTAQNLQAFYRTDGRSNQTARKQKARDVGMRLMALLEWNKVSATFLRMSGQAKHDFEEQKMREHLDEIRGVAVMLRRAINRPEARDTGCQVVSLVAARRQVDRDGQG